MARIPFEKGATDTLLDVAGLQIGHAVDETVRTGVTVVLPDNPAVMGVDVRGGAPGTRDTDALDPTCLVTHFHGLVLSGGSEFGLAAADGVTNYLSENGVGLDLGWRHVPVVPSAILFDLGNGGNKDWGMTPPYRELGIRAAHSAGANTDQGRIGAGYGATAGAVPGGIGMASAQTEDGLIVAALVAVNSFGAVGDEAFDDTAIHLPKTGAIGANTTIGLVATNLALDKAGATRLAIMAQDGLARTIRPVHTPYDGDTIFAMATGGHKGSGTLPRDLTIAGTLAADTMARAVKKAISK